ncbi:hypothetical protein CLV62_101304 [Dysgonomonas alginatilytica]|uniref:Uncharacterized protein n=1 Tax=Dysgonomonas alginatilytica TaxID=1605892 RepID=A0A2V3Q127_9BACT|nr:hypothetical protein [Dysgonomonas alginatilytica]PXV69035.1 hypothetical protein CLV62_101304 [Dysgonomonas alginatilytica]
MKKGFMFIFSLLSIGLCMAQVGINTLAPLSGSVFHIDGAGDNTSSASVTAAQAANDVLIDAKGNIGAGTVTPTAKLHIATTGTTPAMRIADGTQGLNKILRADASGNASWINPPTTDGVIYNITGSTTTSYANNVYNLLKAIQVTNTGNFLVTIRWWGISSSLNTAKQTAAYFYVMQSSSAANVWSTDSPGLQDQVEYYVMPPGDSGRFCFSTSLFARVVAGTYLKVYIRVSIGGPWVIGTSSSTNTTWNPSIVVYRV